MYLPLSFSLLAILAPATASFSSFKLSSPSSESSYHFNPLEHSAGVTPYFTPHNPPLNPSLPQGCNVTRAAYLIRHAAIYPNDFEYESYIEPFIEKLQNSSQAWQKTTTLKFLSNWTAPVNETHLDELTNVGYREARSLGQILRARYEGLEKPKKIWSSTAERTVKSARGFLAGFSHSVNSSAGIDLAQVEESESSGANSLTPYKGCAAYSSSYGSDQSSAFGKIYTKPIIARLKDEAPSFNFTQDDITGMFLLCGYETVIRGHSPFCSMKLFSPDDWLAYEYASDLKYFHNTGYGRELSSTLGLPWVNASLAALDEDSSSQELYVSFTHREVPPVVLTALGLYNNSAYSGANDVNGTMPEDRINYNRVWKSSEILPFLTNVAIERMECRSYGFDRGVYYRVLNNDGPQPLVQCRDGPGGSCSREEFRKFVKGRIESTVGYNEACGGDYPTSLTIYEE